MKQPSQKPFNLQLLSMFYFFFGGNSPEAQKPVTSVVVLVAVVVFRIVGLLCTLFF